MKIDMEAIDRILSNVTFYDDAYNRNLVYAKYTMQSGEPRLSSIDSEDFKAFLRIAYFEETRNIDEMRPNIDCVISSSGEFMRRYNEPDFNYSPSFSLSIL